MGPVTAVADGTLLWFWRGCRTTAKCEFGETRYQMRWQGRGPQGGTDGTTGTDGKQVQVLQRALALLEVLSNEEAGVSRLAEVSKLHKATVYRILRTLMTMGYVLQDDVDHTYRIGYRLIALGQRALNRFDLRKVTRPILERLRDESGCTVHLGLLDSGEIVYIDKVESNSNVRMASYIGARVPVHCTALGKAIVSSLPPGQVDQLLEHSKLEPHTDRTITDRPRLLEELARCRERGFALDDGENEVGIRCVAAPIFRDSGLVVAAVSISAPVFQLTEEVVAERSRQVVDAARQISSVLGVGMEVPEVSATGHLK